MKIAGIISEYNPFHAGHLYHIQETKRQTGCDYVVACMSGAFTQRGETAFMDKFDRAEAALRAGVDAVLELPVNCAVRPAEWFAMGGVSILGAAGCDVLSFGCEEGDADKVKRLSELMADEPEALKAAIRAGLSEGKTLARARGEALSSVYAGLENAPNLSLGLEYLAAIRRLNLNMEICVVKRTAPYHSNALANALSAQEIRLAVSMNKSDWALSSLPAGAREVFARALPDGISDRSRLDALILHAIRSLAPEERERLPDAGEGLGERLYAKAQAAASAEALIELVKCKRYTRARITRLMAAAVLKLTREPEANPYVRLLGFRRDAEPLVREMSLRANGRLITDAAKLEGNPTFEIEKRATDLWGLSAAAERYRRAGRERTEKFIKV